MGADDGRLRRDSLRSAMPIDAAEMTLHDYAGVMMRRKWIVIASALITTLVAVAMSALQTPIYSAGAEVLVEPRGQGGLFNENLEYVDYRAIDTEIKVMEGQAVRDRVRSDLGVDGALPGVSGSSIGDTDVIGLTVRDPNAANAAILANAYAEAYIDIRREQSVNELLAASTEVQIAIDDIESQIAALEAGDPSRGPLVTQLANFNTTLDQLRVDAALRTGGAITIRSADTPGSPIEPTPLRTAILALIVGVMIGLGAAFFVDYLDDKVRIAEDLEKLTPRAILAEVPVDPPTGNEPFALSDPNHLSVEAYRGLRTNVQFLALDQTLNVVQITSSLAGEGKTTTATNLAIVLARAGHRVALIDADLRRPRIHEAFDVPTSPGLTDLLLGGLPKDAVNVVDIGNDHRLFVYTAGVVPSNPSEMLSGRRMKKLIAQMGDHYDFVVVDSAPVLPVSDSVALAGFVDAVIVVAHAGRVTTSNVTDTLERLDKVAAPVIGLVLNQVQEARADNYYYYGGYSGVGGAKAEHGAIFDEDESAEDTSETIFSDL